MSRRTNKELIAGIREHRRLNCIHELGHLDFDMPKDVRKAIEERYKEGFNLWWDSWIAPLVNEIERRLVKPKKRKEGKDGTREAGDGGAGRDPGPEARDL